MIDEDRQALDEMRERDSQRRRQADLRELMTSQASRRWVSTLLEFAGIFRLSFNGDMHWTAFKEGQRNVGLKVFAELQDACPELYLLMQQEHVDEQRKVEDERSSERSDSGE